MVAVGLWRRNDHAHRPGAAEAELRRLLDVMAALRDPGHGCPWDKEQSFATIAPYTIKEAYEVADAIARADFAGFAGRTRRPAVSGRLPRADGRGEPAGSTLPMSRKPSAIRWSAAIHMSLGMRRPAMPRNKAWPGRPTKVSRGPRGGDRRPGRRPGRPPCPHPRRQADSPRRPGRFDWPDASAVLSKLDEEVAEVRAELQDAKPEKTCRRGRRSAVRNREPGAQARSRRGSVSAAGQSEVRSALQCNGARRCFCWKGAFRYITRRYGRNLAENKAEQIGYAR